MRVFAFLLGVVFTIGFILFFITKESYELQIIQETQEKQNLQKSSLRYINLASFDMGIVSFKDLKAILNTNKSDSKVIFFDSLMASEVYIDLDKILTFKEDEKNSFEVFINSVNIKQVRLKYKNEIYEGEFRAQDVKYKDIFDIKNFKTTFAIGALNVSLDGSVNKNSINAKVETRIKNQPFEAMLDLDSSKLEIVAKEQKAVISNLKLNNINLIYSSDFIKHRLETSFDVAVDSFNFKDIKLSLESSDFKTYDILLCDTKAKAILGNNDILIKSKLLKHDLSLMSTLDFKRVFFSYLDQKAMLEIDKELKSATLDIKIDSIATLLQKLSINNNIDFDAMLHIKSSIDFSNSLSSKTELSMPSFEYSLNKTKYKNSKKSSMLIVQNSLEMLLQELDFELFSQKISLDRTAKLKFIDNALHLDLSLLDGVKIDGVINTNNIDLSIRAKNYKLEYLDTLATINADLVLKNSLLSGAIEFIDLKSAFKPNISPFIGDNDIIILTKDRKHDTNFDLDLAISSKNSLFYNTDELTIEFIPMLHIVKNTTLDPQIYGLIKINSGEITLGDKEIELLGSEVYFNGNNNPYLNINLQHNALDNTKINIYATNTLNKPLFILSSDPWMSQSDIMSYLLFGSSSSDIFETNRGDLNKGATTLGYGLKELFNKTKLFRIDTLNILNNQSGTLGYEIGASFNKNLRVLYKNSDISAVVLQYKLGKSLQFEVDAKETSQGVGIYYIKDFSLP